MKNSISFPVLMIIILHGSIRCYGNDTNFLRNIKLSAETVIQSLSEDVRYLIKNGDAPNGVPVLDPYRFLWKQLNLAAGEKFNANMTITDAKLTGLGNFVLQEFNFSKSEIAIDLHITIPSLKFRSEYYELYGNLFEAIPLKGQGIIDIEIYNILLRGTVFLKQSEDGKSMLLGKIENPEFSIERIVSRTQFDKNIDHIINSMVEDLLADYLTRFNKYLATSYIEYIPLYLNPVLAKYELWNLINVILYG